MNSEISVKINDKFKTGYANGYPLVTKEALENAEFLQTEGSILKLVDKQGRFLAKGYYGLQNKGYGWVLTNDENETVDQAFIERKLTTAISRRQAFFNNSETTAFRVFNGEGDGFGGLIIDYYDGFYLLSWYSEGVYTFKDQVIAALQNVTECKGIYQKKRFDTKGQYIEEDDFVAGERGEFPLVVKENGVNFAVYLNDGAMTGIFLDQRDVRNVIKQKYAKGKTVLNTFSYTGAFSVAAALGGARKTTSVDLAKRSSSKTIEQFSVNGIDFENQDILVMDVFNYFKYAKRKELRFDVVILDPPSFARSKKYTFSTSKDYTNLMKEAIAITEKNGVIVASTNSASFGMKKFKGFIDKAFKELGGKYSIVEEFTLPSDFRVHKEFKEGNYLKVLFVKLG
ncbi:MULTISPECIES: class I SAM-dependent rRNA methyltransferase [Planococcus]|uniref:50S rRNA methyltransferase n=1 Tax=Planococcus faecalis TaxID=1598147 RepID=A0ABN4XKT1_9BACL|nr:MULTISPECIES: class I SAM-dependent rRNA methyltransferase [Planococcus]AQU78035.1 50S rRNA methyltransferase [Planococcus faecalis]KAA0957404.1 class I SAM-dependent rRNA methyltransferase [Planococcus sp. ANT_H30]MDJ0331344.1 class I SAM-dependent rRNA methyltransferase [Planococcus sp. S3-L1]